MWLLILFGWCFIYILILVIEVVSLLSWWNFNSHSSICWHLLQLNRSSWEAWVKLMATVLFNNNYIPWSVFSLFFIISNWIRRSFTPFVSWFRGFWRDIIADYFLFVLNLSAARLSSRRCLPVSFLILSWHVDWVIGLIIISIIIKIILFYILDNNKITCLQDIAHFAFAQAFMSCELTGVTFC